MSNPLNNHINHEFSAFTNHFANERTSRQSLIDRLGGDGNHIAVIYWDKGHRDGAEFHILTDNGIIIVENARSGRLITKKLARMGQIRQLVGRYDQLNHRVFTMATVPQRVIVRCRFYTENGYNNM